MLAAAVDPLIGHKQRPVVVLTCSQCSRRTVANIYETGRGALFIGEMKTGPVMPSRSEGARGRNIVSLNMMHLLEDETYRSGLAQLGDREAIRRLSARTALGIGVAAFLPFARCPRGCAAWEFDEDDLRSLVRLARDKRRTVARGTSNVTSIEGEAEEWVALMWSHPSSDTRPRDVGS